MKNNLNLTIITSGVKPVPAVDGGAVEVLIESFLRNNETFKKFNITLFSIESKSAKIASKNFENVEFIFIQNSMLKQKLSKFFRYFVNRYLPFQIPNQFLSEVLRYEQVIGKADIVLVENKPGFIKCLRKVSTAPLILHLHNDYLNVNNKKTSIKALKLTDHVISVSKFICKRVADLGVNNCTLTYIYNGVDLNRFKGHLPNDKANLIKAKYGIGADDKVIVFTGRIKESKGVNVLLKAFEKLKHHENLKLLLVGELSDSNQYFINQFQSFISKQNERVILTGFIPYDDIHELYSISLFSVLPSLAEEAFGLTVIESLACALPTIVSDSGAMPELIDDSCGFIIKRNEKMVHELYLKMDLLLSDKPLRRKLSEGAQNKSSVYSIESYNQNLTNYLKQVVS